MEGVQQPFGSFRLFAILFMWCTLEAARRLAYRLSP